MKIQQKIILFIIILLAIILIPNVVNAAYKDTFTTPSGITAKKVVTGTDGIIEFRFSNIELNQNHNYIWSVSYTSDPSNVRFQAILNQNNFNVTNKTATVTFSIGNGSSLELLRETNNVYISIKDNTTGAYVVESLNIDLTLPAMKAFRVSKASESSNLAYTLSSNGDTVITQATTYGIKDAYFKFVKMTNQSVIDQYNQAIANGTDLSTLTCFARLEEAPTDWTKCVTSVNYNDNCTGILKSNLPTEAGVYYMWIKGTGTNIKNIYGYSIISVTEDTTTNGPKVTSINVETPAQGSYRAPETVKINVYFNETINGTTVPTLKIKFGESPIRELTNGTIKNQSAAHGSHYIEYTYNIQNSDVGKLKAIELTGGDIKDETGTAAKLSCPNIQEEIIAKGTKGPEISYIDVTEPMSGSYKTPQKVQIYVGFDDEIIGTTVPTLKIRFGNSPVREITNGVILNEDSGIVFNAIIYEYNIQDTDIGQLEVVDIVGGNITDNAGRQAILTNIGLDPKYIIKANVEDDNNNGGNNNEGNGSGNNGGNQGNTQGGNNGGKGDGTTMGSKLPQTGEGMFTLIAIVVISGIAIVFFIKSRKYRGIK